MTISIDNGPYSTTPSPRRQALYFDLWAQDGVVYMEDRRNGEFYVLKQSKARHRRDAFAAEADIWDKKREGAGDPKKSAYARDMYEEMKSIVQALDACLYDARAQGDPDDEEVRRKKMRAFITARPGWSGTGWNVPADPVTFGPHSLHVTGETFEERIARDGVKPFGKSVSVPAPVGFKLRKE